MPYFIFEIKGHKAGNASIIQTLKAFFGEEKVNLRVVERYESFQYRRYKGDIPDLFDESSKKHTAFNVGVGANNTHIAELSIYADTNVDRLIVSTPKNEDRVPFSYSLYSTDSAFQNRKLLKTVANNNIETSIEDFLDSCFLKRNNQYYSVLSVGKVYEPQIVNHSEAADNYGAEYIKKYNHDSYFNEYSYRFSTSAKDCFLEFEFSEPTEINSMHFIEAHHSSINENFKRVDLYGRNSGNDSYKFLESIELRINQNEKKTVFLEKMYKYSQYKIEAISNSSTYVVTGGVYFLFMGDFLLESEKKPNNEEFKKYGFSDIKFPLDLKGKFNLQSKQFSAYSDKDSDFFYNEFEFVFLEEDEALYKIEVQSDFSPLCYFWGEKFRIITDKISDQSQERYLVKGIKKDSTIKTNKISIFGNLKQFIASTKSSEIKLAFSENGKDWFSFKKVLGEVEKNQLDISSTREFSLKGMSVETVNRLSIEDLKDFSESVYVAFYFPTFRYHSNDHELDKFAIVQSAPLESSEIYSADYKITNTTPTLNLNFKGNVLQGVANDDDETNIQYCVLLNNKKIFPSDTDWTRPLKPPFDIAVGLDINDIHLDVENTLKIVFKDSWGTQDSWTTKFIGERSGLLFYDVTGELYSTEIGEVLKYLDFGVITAGQTTIEHEIIIKNQYAYDISDLLVWVETPESNPFPDGMEAEISKSLSPFISEPVLKFDSVMRVGEEKSFYIRLFTTLGATPNAAGSFDIKVKAKKVE